MLKCSVNGVFWPKLVIWLFLSIAPSLFAHFNSNKALKLTITLSTTIMRAILLLCVHISDFRSRFTHPWKIIFAFTLTYYIYHHHKRTCYATQKNYPHFSAWFILVFFNFMYQILIHKKLVRGCDMSKYFIPCKTTLLPPKRYFNIHKFIKTI